LPECDSRITNIQILMTAPAIVAWDSPMRAATALAGVSLVTILRESAAAALSGWPEQPGIEVGVADSECTTWTGEYFAAPVFEAAW
jgi:hypothetical protein